MSRHRAVRNLRPEDYQDYDDYYEDEPASPGLAPMSPSLAQFLRPREVPSFALDDVFESLPASGGQPDFQEDDFPAPGQASNASISWGKMKVKKGKGKWKKGKGKAKALLGTDEAKEDSKPQATGPENELQSGDLPKKRAVFHRERTDSDRARSEKAIEELTNSKRLASSQSVDDLSSLRSQLDAIDAADSIHASGNRPPEISVAYSSPKTGGSPLRRSASSTAGWRNSPTRFTVPKQASPSPKSSNSKTPKSPSSGFSLSAKERAHREKVLDMQSRLDAEQEASGTHKSNLNLVVIGHVDAGKSTLMGHLLFLKGQVSKKQLDKFEKESRELNKASFHFAWVLDQHKEERTRGITTDVGRGFFETPSKRVTLLDAPGHRDFVPNMITGASQADAAVLAVSAAAEEFEAGFQDDGQTKEHAVLAKSLGVNQLIVAVNKLDSVGWSRQRYEEILDKLCSFLTTLGFRSEDIWPVPVSGLKGINILSARASSSSSPSLSSSSSSSSSPCSQMFPSKSVSPELQRWYKGPSLVDLVDKLALPPREVDKKMRFCISDVFRSTTGGDCVAGNLLTGKLVVNDKVLIKPFALMAKVKKIERDEALVEVGKAGDALVLSLQILSDADKLKVGQVLCDPDFPVPQVKRFRTKIITLDNKLPIIPGCRCVLFMATCQEQVTISKLISLKVGDTTKRKPRRIPKNCRHAEVEITADRSLCIETFEDIKY